MWWMTVTADGCRDYLVKRIPSVLLPAAPSTGKVQVVHRHTYGSCCHKNVNIQSITFTGIIINMIIIIITCGIILH